MENIINLTPHAIHIYDEHKKLVATIPASGHVLRVGSKPQRFIENIEYEKTVVPIFSPADYTTCEGIEDIDITGKDLIVSWVCGEGLMKERKDFPHRILNPDTGPDSVVRDEQGKIIGVRRFILMNPKV